MPEEGELSMLSTELTLAALSEDSCSTNISEFPVPKITPAAAPPARITAITAPAMILLLDPFSGDGFGIVSLLLIVSTQSLYNFY